MSSLDSKKTGAPNASSFAGLDLLATAVILLDTDSRILYLNPAAESLLAVSVRNVLLHPIHDVLAVGAALKTMIDQAFAEARGFVDQDLVIGRPGQEAQHLNCIVTPVESHHARLLIELRHIDQQLRAEREEQRISQAEANRSLIRNLAHEIKNPLGGLRGSAQLLERELDRAELREYTQVIIKEADRLQLLMDRLLTPNRPPQFSRVNIHEVCERVRSLILAEFPRGLRVVRSYDVSLPDLHGDREQLIQVVLNIARNAAQAIAANGEGQLTLKTCVARHVMLKKYQHKLALELQVMDNGPGIPDEIREKMFFPLVSGREGGTGLGLTLAQTFVQHHGGAIEADSEPGRTCFRVILPL
ncbi:MAG: PAS domain-containing protein [Betaproteobacteria bacterium]|nr:PAS domain-containing protein [Betaproteobacteria bacterium]